MRDNDGFAFGPLVRRWVLTFHIVVSVGWVGVDLCVLVLGVVGGSAGDRVLGRAALVVLGVIGDWVVVPLAVLALVSGVVVGVGSRWKLVGIGGCWFRWC